VDMVQLRDKQGADLEAAHRFRSLCDQLGALLIVNDHPELALECGADGVHVGQDDMPLPAVRALVGPGTLIGISTHSPAQVDAAERSEADYLGVGPVFATATKPQVEPVGLELVRYAAEHARKPWFAIGGIDTTNVAEVRAAGATRIAVVRAIRDAPDPKQAARELGDG
jgi:thiamine-phosphate pyrophosphorylase